MFVWTFSGVMDAIALGLVAIFFLVVLAAVALAKVRDAFRRKDRG